MGTLLSIINIRFYALVHSNSYKIFIWLVFSMKVYIKGAKKMSNLQNTDLPLVSKHMLIDGFNESSSSPFVRDCGCVCRFSISDRKNRFRTAIRERKGSKRSNSIKSESSGISEISSRLNRNNIMSRKNSDEQIFENISILNNPAIKRYETKCFFDFQTVPILYKSTLVIPEEEQPTYKDKVYFKRKIFQSRVIEKITLTCSQTYISTFNFDVKDHFIELQPQESLE